MIAPTASWATELVPLAHEPTEADMKSLFERLSYHDVSKTIDHSLLRPEINDAFIAENLALAADYDVASVTMRPVDVEKAVAGLRGRDVKVGAVVGFPHGSSLTVSKVFETERALKQGALEIDMVLPFAALRSGRDADVEADIRAVVDETHAAGGIVKVIFENAYLTDDEKIRACHLSEAAGADFVKTSTGFAPSGATHADLILMRANTPAHMQVKAAGGVRTLDALLAVMCLGVTRVGATATKAMLDDFKARKAGADGTAVTRGADFEPGAY